MRPNKLPFILRNIQFILIAILSIKIAGYFSIVEDRTINQVYKTIVRLGMSGSILLIYFKLIRYGCSTRVVYKGIFSVVFYLFYLVLGFASIGWSSNPQYSALQLLMTGESFLFMFFYIRVFQLVNFHFDWLKLNPVKLIGLAVLPIIISFIIGNFLLPDIFWRTMRGGEESRLGGYLMNPNELGMLAGIGAVMFLMPLVQGRKVYWNVLKMVLCAYVLLLTSSRSSVIGFAIVSVLLVLNSSHQKIKLYLIGVIIIAIPVLIKLIVFKDEGGLDEVMSMTGRLPFWKALLNEGIVKEPFLGYGFMRINYTDYFQGLNTYPGKMTHNTFMQVLMNLGFVGLVVALFQLILTIRNYFVHLAKEHKLFFVALFIPIIVNSITEFGIFGESNYGILFYQFLIFYLVVSIPEKRSTKEKILQKIFKKRWNC